MTELPQQERATSRSMRGPFYGQHTQLLFPGMAPFYARLGPVTYALLRIGFGMTMFTHGIPKLLREAHGSMADPFASSTNLIANGLGLPFAPQFAQFVTILETFGGLAVALGLLTRLIAPMFAVEMAVISILLGPTWPWTDRGIEYPVMLGLLALHLSFRGGGPASVDRLIGREL